jgi:inorganic triphosphatase YgiF
MSYQAVFQRYELKYLLTQPQRAALLSLMPAYMKLDDYGRTTIRNVYFDTDSFLLARRSIEKPIYKEKLRLRCYGRAEVD